MPVGRPEEPARTWAGGSANRPFGCFGRAPIRSTLGPGMYLPESPVLPRQLAGIAKRHPRVHVIVAPPRSRSTALARVFWERPEVRYYCHEPFEVTYYRDEGLEEVAGKLADPLDLEQIKSLGRASGADELVIKEMPYQVGSRFPVLAALATQPLVFLLRDPRLTIASRMAKKREGGESQFFPEIESGWTLLRSQIDWCRDQDIPHVLIDASDFRGQASEVLPLLFDRLGLTFDDDMLKWKACPDVDLDNLGGRHRHLYRRVLSSTGILAEESEPPPVASFPKPNGWREHVARCLEIYRGLADREERVALAVPASP